MSNQIHRNLLCVQSFLLTFSTFHQLNRYHHQSIHKNVKLANYKRIRIFFDEESM